MTRRARAKRTAIAVSGPRHSGRRALMAIAWLVLLGGSAYGLSLLEAQARRINQAPTRLEWVNAPLWLQEASWQHVLREIEAAVDLHPDTDIYDDTVCLYVATHVAQSPWVAVVSRVTKLHDGRVRIEADFRMPFTFVEHRGVAYLIDAHGTRLPPSLAAEFVNTEKWLPIRGVAASPPVIGQKWTGGDLQDGLKMVQFLYAAEVTEPLIFRDSIRAVDVSNYNYRRRAGDGWLTLITRNPRSYIHWGLPPGEEYGVESPARRKLAALARFYQDRGGFPDDGPIDIRDEDRIVIRESQ